MANGGDNKAFWTFILGGILGAATASALGARGDDEELTPEEIEELEELEEIAGEIERLLCDWSPPFLENEDEYRDDLYEYLSRRSRFEIEHTPPTRIGRPDILVENRLVLDVKLDVQRAADRDRALGQAIRYSDDHPLMWMILVDTTRQQGEELLRLLETNNLDRIAIWHINSVSDDDDLDEQDNVEDNEDDGDMDEEEWEED